MIISQTDICNLALSKLGASTITNITDDDKNASVMALLWDVVRQSELRKSFWGFSIKRDKLPAVTQTQVSGYRTMVQKPGDFLRLIQLGDFYGVPSLDDYVGSDNSIYTIESDKILCDFDAPVSIRYVSNVTDTALFDPLFAQTLACRLAFEACYKLTNSNTLRQAVATEYEVTKREAIAVNAIERPPISIADDSWIIRRI